MPGSVVLSEARRAPTLDPGVAYRMCLVGHCSATIATTGHVSALYSGPAELATDGGLGDVIDAGLQALTKTNGNPQPSSLAIYNTPATTPGVRGSLTITGVLGTSVVTATASTHPLGTYQPVTRIPTGYGGTVGVAGMFAETSLDNGRTWLPRVALGTASSYAPTLGGIDLGISYDLGAGTLLAGDTWSEAKTTPPMWADADLYTAGPPATGAFAAIGNAATPFGIIVITEPTASGDLATIIAGLNYLFNTYGQYPLCIIRFRDPTSGETEAAYITAFQTFRASIHDDRICVVVGSGWLTEPYRAFRYLRSGLPAVLARMQSFVGLPNEKLAHHPGFGGDGPLEGFTIVDDNGFLIGHDERTRSGIDGPINSNGGGLTFYLERAEGVQGTYVSKAPVMYAAGGTVLTMMDRRVVSDIRRELYAVAFSMLQGVVSYTTVGSVNTVLPDIQEAVCAKLKKAIADKFAAEFQNATDPNLVEMNPIVTVSGADVTFSITVNDKLFGYANTINIVLQNSR